MSAVPIEKPADPLTVLLEKIDGIAVLPHVVFKVLEVSSSEDAPPLELDRAISVDPGFSSKVLTLANSAFFGLPRKVTSIREAILFLGFRAVRNLALTIGTYDVFVGKNDKDSLRRRGWWRQSVDAAVACKWLSFFTQKANPDDSYTCGLLHLLGKTLLDRFGEGDFERVTMMVEIGMSEFEAEYRVFGCNHVEVSTGAAERWGFPEKLVSGLIYDLPAEPEDPAAAQRACTALGSAIARVRKFRSENPGMNETEKLPDWALDCLSIPRDRVEVLLEQGLGAIAAAQLHMA